MAPVRVPLVAITVLALSLVVLAGAVPAHADTTYRLDATPTASNEAFSAFYFIWRDADLHEGQFALFTPDVLIEFSVVSHRTNHATTELFFYNSLGRVPGPTECPFTLGQTDSWAFYSTDLGWTVFGEGAWWTYERSVVPLPPSAFLLASGLIPLAWARRKKRWRK